MKILLLSLFLLVSTLLGSVGKITALSGDISLVRETKNIDVKIGTIINEKDKLATGDNSRLQLVFNDKTIISLGKNSTFDVQEYFFDEAKPNEAKANFKVAKGIFKSITGRIGKVNPTKFKLQTKSASIGIRGTIFFGAIQPGKPDNIACTQGAIVVETAQGMVEVPAGQFTTVEVGQAPTPPAPIPAAQAQELEKNSGADENQKESGEGAGTAPAQTAQPTEGGGNTPPTNTPPDNDTPPEVVPVPEPYIPPIPTVPDDPDDDPIPYNPHDDPDPTPDPTPDPITKTYNIWGSAIYTPSSGLTLNPNDDTTGDNYESFYGSLIDDDGTSNYSLVATDGKLGGEISLYTYFMDGSKISQNSYGFPSATTQIWDSNYHSLPTPATTYLGFVPFEDYEDTTTSFDGNSVTQYTNFYTDSLGEFLIWNTSYYDDVSFYEYEKTYLMGIKTDFSALPSDGISHYIDPDYFNDALSSYYNNYFTYFAPTMVNWKNKNLLTYEVRTDGVFIGMGLINQETGTTKTQLDGSFYESTLDFSEKLTSTSTDMHIFGSEYQGWGGTMTVEDNSGDIGQYTHGEYKIPYGALSTQVSTEEYTFDNPEDTITPTGSSDLEGFTGSGELDITLDRTNGITGTIYGYEGDITFGGVFGTGSSYITDDYFAALGFDGTYMSTDDVTGGWLIAVDSGSVYADGTDDEISWGLWGLDLNGPTDTAYDIATCAWVAGQNIVSDISSMNMSGIVNYSGQAMGILTDTNSLTTFIDPSISTMNLAFDFGSGDLTAELNANSGSVIKEVTMSSDILQNATSIYSATGEDYQAGLYSEITGSFYNEGATTAGNFMFSDNTGTAQGVYKAAQQAIAP